MDQKTGNRVQFPVASGAQEGKRIAADAELVAGGENLIISCRPEPPRPHSNKVLGELAREIGSHRETWRRLIKEMGSHRWLPKSFWRGHIFITLGS